jgi:hypothetical protein
MPLGSRLTTARLRLRVRSRAPRCRVAGLFRSERVAGMYENLKPTLESARCSPQRSTAIPTREMPPGAPGNTSRLSHLPNVGKPTSLSGSSPTHRDVENLDLIDNHPRRRRHHHRGPTSQENGTSDIQTCLWCQVVCDRALTAANPAGCAVHFMAALMIAQEGTPAGEGFTQFGGEDVGV